MITGKFPALRLRRNRKTDWSRRLIEENNLTPNDFILPIFLIDGKNKKPSIKSMPGVYRYTIDKLNNIVDRAIKKIGKIKSLGVRLFSSINLLDQSVFLLRLSLNAGNFPVIMFKSI